MNFLSVIIRGLLLFSLLLCLCGKTSKKSDLISAQQYGISAYTSGVISRESPIRLLFAEPCFTDTSKFNTPVEPSPFSFSPSIKGVTVWANSTTLEFRPSERLQDGKTYKATLKIHTANQPKKDLKPFTFNFTGMQQSFSINFTGFEAIDKTDLKYQRYTGNLVTADSDNDNEIEKIVTAVQNNQNRIVFWTHNEDNRTHMFTIDSVVRSENKSSLKIKWDGKFINVKNAADTLFDVPSINDFDVLQIRAVQDTQNYIEIRFSDPLAADQHLAGLVSVSGYNDCKYTVNNNVLSVHSSTVFSGTFDVSVEPGIKNSANKSLKQGTVQTLIFDEVKPQVRFAGKGVIIPTSQGQTVPFEAVNVRAVIVEAVKIYEKNMGQFLQVNDLDGSDELKRVGKTVWKKRVELGFTQDKTNQWIHCGFDVSQLITDNPGGLYRISISFRKSDAVIRCSDNNTSSENEEFIIDNSVDERDESNWDNYNSNDEYYNDYENYNEEYNQRENPCSDAYYKKLGGHDIKVIRNVLISDIGLICKSGTDSFSIIANDIRSTEPMSGAAIRLLDFQQQLIANGTTDSRGMVTLASDRTPFIVIAQKGTQSGYLRLSKGSALSVSQFDVGGEKIDKGLKGYFFGERGVWRPGDSLFLTFILNDPDKKIPAEHPVTFELFDARGRLAKTMKAFPFTNGFYLFKVATLQSDPTGEWIAKVKVGGAVFQKPLKIETVMPNRLKIKLDFGKKVLRNKGSVTGMLSSQWLHGAIAGNLDADVSLTLQQSVTTFSKYSGYIFDNPAQLYETENFTIFEGSLDDKGNAPIEATINSTNSAPGMLLANFKTRVFEPSGAFSSDRYTIPFSPFDRYIGILCPKGDIARGMLLTDTNHIVKIAALTPEGEAAPDTKVEMKLYQINWRWWWEKGQESLADYTGSSSITPVVIDTVNVKEGTGEWSFRVNYPSWGRYLLTAKDLDGGHTTGKIMYIDWPGWAGRAQKEGSGANILTFTSDKTEYAVGEDINITIPSGEKGRALVSLENGRKILKQEWIIPINGTMKYRFKAESSMAPNVYVYVTYLQPHLTAGNDIPIRTYGIIPVKISNPQTLLHPEVKTPSSFRPQEKTTITVSEADGRPMTYTLAVVDEGLLDLTRFTTPDPWAEFNKREGLGVNTWDLYDLVSGAYGATLDKLLTIGGSDENAGAEKRKQNRFPPMVRFYGPFDLKHKQSNHHQIDIPLYTGSVRVMVVAGNTDAWGKCEKAVPVKKPVMVLATLPRVLSVNESTQLPVSVFALEKSVKNVKVSVDINGPLALGGTSVQHLTFDNPGDKICAFKAIAGSSPGYATVKITASSGTETAHEEITLEIRSPMRHVSVSVDTLLKSHESWLTTVAYPGISGTNNAVLEISRLFPFNLNERLSYLIQYPYGCIEQTTSSVFPQLYLNKLIDLPKDKAAQTQKNIEAGIMRLRTFQTSEGGFAYWPGDRECSEWGSNYAGHFLLEAQHAGYAIPSGLLQGLMTYQQKKARAWNSREAATSLTQVYRLFTLALAGQAELGAMNRMREIKDLSSTDKWLLAAAYYLAGQKDAGLDILKTTSEKVTPYRELSNTYGSDFRDKAIILEAMVLTGQSEKAMLFVNDIAKVINSSRWLSTQETAYTLVALARLTASENNNKTVQFNYSWNGSTTASYSMAKPVHQIPLSIKSGESGSITLNNTGTVPLYARIIARGIPKEGTEKAAANNLKLSVTYKDKNGNTINPKICTQAQDIVITVNVKHTGIQSVYQNVALAHLIPSGWEIHNNRMDPDLKSKNSLFDYQDIRDDRVYTFFSLKAGEEKSFTILTNASYTGTYYLPMIYAEVMYDASINSLVPGEWIEIRDPE